MSFADATQWKKTGAGVYEGTIEEGWFQGRGAFGGLVGAVIVEAAVAEVGDPARVVRTANIHFSAPAAAGPARAMVEVLRSGNRITQAAVRIVQGDAIVTFGSVTLSKPRPDTMAYARAVMPDVPPPAAIAPFPSYPDGPKFLQHYELRFAWGVPFSGANEPRMAAWIRPRVGVPVTAGVMLGISDVLPAACCAMMAAPRPIASVDLGFNALAPLPSAQDAFYLVSIESRWAGDGYTEELRDLWDERGVLVAQCRQVIALL